MGVGFFASLVLLRDLRGFQVLILAVGEKSLNRKDAKEERRGHKENRRVLVKQWLLPASKRSA